MSWHYLRGAAAESWEEGSWAGAPDALLNSLPFAVRSYLLDNETASCTPSPFGTTSAPLTAGHGEEASISFQEGSRVRTLVLPAREIGKMETLSSSGFKWPGSFAKYSPDSCSWRTRQCLLLGGLAEFSETWPKWGLMHDGECLALKTPERHTFGTGSGLWPTPTANDAKNNGGPSQFARSTIALNVRVKMETFPPKSSDTHGGGKSAFNSPLGRTAGGKRTPPWATPNATDWKNRQKAKQNRCLPREVGGKLHPDWVEWLMGWPIGWTASEPLEMAKFRQFLNLHGKF